MDKKKFYDDLCEEEQKLREEEKQLQIQAAILDDKIKALLVLIQYYNIDNPVTEKVVSYEIPVVKANQKSLFPISTAAKKKSKKRLAITVPGMVLKSLEVIEKGSTHDIAKKMIELFPSVSFEKALKDTKHNVSLLSKNEKIKVIERNPGRIGFIYQSIS